MHWIKISSLIRVEPQVIMWFLDNYLKKNHLKNHNYHFRIFHTIKKPQNPVQVQFSAKTTTPKRAKQANESNLIGVWHPSADWHLGWSSKFRSTLEWLQVLISAWSPNSTRSPFLLQISSKSWFFRGNIQSFWGC